MMKPRIMRALKTIAPLVVLVAAVLLLRPPALGGAHSYVIVAGQSMQPGLQHGDLVFARRQESYRVGDVVAYRIPKDDPGAGKVVIHRIVGGSAQSGYVLRGDNRRFVDVWRPRAPEIVGKMRMSVPRGGRALLSLSTPFALATLGASLAFMFVLFGRR